ncbi:MAG: RNA-binding protein [Dethiobacteria bacterium]|jgi:large subunit ribosomal protein L14e
MDMESGQVVKSLAGRDQGTLYLIIGFEGNRALLANGRSHTVQKPKKKNLKHLQPYRCVVPEIKERIRQGNLSDNAVRNTLNMIISAERGQNHPCCLRTSSSEGC